MEFDRIIENVYDKLRYALKVTYKGREYIYKEGDDLDEEIALAIFNEKEISLRFIDTEISVIVFQGSNLLELDVYDPGIQRGLEEDGLHLEIVDLLTRGLKGDARETWEDILESKEQFDIKCIRGPYWLPDEVPDADEHFGYDCTLNGNKFIVGEEPADEFRYIYDMDKKDYNMYVKNKKDIMPLIRKAIELHKLKKGLKGSASYTWGDILS
jgi:hypothetical protein